MARFRYLAVFDHDEIIVPAVRRCGSMRKYNDHTQSCKSMFLVGFFGAGDMYSTGIAKGPLRLPYKTIQHQPSDKIRLKKTARNGHVY